MSRTFPSVYQSSSFSLFMLGPRSQKARAANFFSSYFIASSLLPCSYSWLFAVRWCSLFSLAIHCCAFLRFYSFYPFIVFNLYVGSCLVCSSFLFFLLFFFFFIFSPSSSSSIGSLIWLRLGCTVYDSNLDDPDTKLWADSFDWWDCSEREYSCTLGLTQFLYMSLMTG